VSVAYVQTHHFRLERVRQPLPRRKVDEHTCSASCHSRIKHGTNQVAEHAYGMSRAVDVRGALITKVQFCSKRLPESVETLTFIPLRTARPDDGNPRLVTENPAPIVHAGA